MTTPEATVVVPVRNAAGVVREQLEALGNQTVLDRLEVIVVDDASTDTTAAVVERWIAAHPDAPFTLVRRSRRGGTNASRNDGLRRASARWMLLCDGDDVVTASWAERLLDARRPDALLGGACLLMGRDPEDRASWIGPEVHSFGWDYAMGGNLGVETAIARSIDGFDERMFSGGTELDFAIRAQMAGAVVTPVADAVILYRFPDRPEGLFPKGIRRERGRVYLSRKMPTAIADRGLRQYLHLWVGMATSLVAVVRRRPRAAGDLALLAGRAIGWPMWALRFRLRMPTPRMLSAANDGADGSPSNPV